MQCPVCGMRRLRACEPCPRCRAVFESPVDASEATTSCASETLRRAGEATTAAAPVDERRFVTVLFTDLCGPTEQVASLDPDEAQRYLGRVLSLMTEAVEAFGGTVGQLFGDGLLALFGAPIAEDDHALRACLAAVDLLRRASAWGVGSDADRRPLALRIGIASGDVVVGAASGLFAHPCRADGSTVHLAARLEQLASPGTALVSGATMRLAGEPIETVSLGALPIRGLRGEVEVYALVTRGQRSAAAPLARRRWMGALVGRATTLARMHAVAAQVLSGSMRALALRGEAGIGKSRVVSEFRRQLGERFVVHGVAARSHTANVPYAIVAELARELIGVPRDMALEPQRLAARAIVAGWPAVERFHRAAVSDLLDLGDADPVWSALLPASRGRRIADLVFWLVTRGLASSPSMIVVEDIFLADRDSERLIESLARRLENMPVLFCFTYRQDFDRRWLDASWLVEHRVGPLSQDEMAMLASGILGDDDSIRPVVDLLVERADGNPLFFEQLAITLVDDGTLRGAPRAYVCVAPDALSGVARTLSGAVSARVDRLSPGTKATLEAAAILSEPASDTLIATMRGIAPADADDQLMHAVSLGLLAARHGGDPARYRFRHGLVQELVAGALTRPRRRMLHRAALVALRAQQGDSSIDRSALLVQHAYHGEDWLATAQLALASMTRALARSANRDAVRVFELGIDAVRRLDAGVVALDLELNLCARAMDALLPLGKVDACIASLQRAEAIALALDDAHRQAAVALRLALVQWTRGSYTLALAAAETAAAAADAAGSRGVQMAARHARMSIFHALGRYADVAAEARALVDGYGDELATLDVIAGWAVIPAISVKAFLADSLWRMAETNEAQRLCDEAYRDLADREHLSSRVLVDFVQGEIWMVEGRSADAAEVFDGALASCTAHDHLAMVPVFVAALGAAMARSGRASDAIVMLEKGVVGERFPQGGHYDDFRFPMSLAIALAEAGRYAEAYGAAEAALAAASAYEQRGHQAQALFELAEIGVAAGRPDHALTHYREAAALADLCSMVLVRRRALARIEQVDDSMRLLDGLQRRDGG